MVRTHLVLGTVLRDSIRWHQLHRAAHCKSIMKPDPRDERPSLRNIFGATSQWHHLFLFLLEQLFFLYILALSFNSFVADYDHFLFFSLLPIPFSGWHHLRQLLIISHLKRWWKMALCCLWKGPQHKSNTPYSGAFELCINSTWLYFYRVENWFSTLVWAQQLLFI